jgi:hypothetical protein
MSNFLSPILNHVSLRVLLSATPAARSHPLSRESQRILASGRQQCKIPLLKQMICRIFRRCEVSRSGQVDTRDLHPWESSHKRTPLGHPIMTRRAHPPLMIPLTLDCCRLSLRFFSSDRNCMLHVCIEICIFVICIIDRSCLLWP